MDFDSQLKHVQRCSEFCREWIGNNPSTFDQLHREGYLDGPAPDIAGLVNSIESETLEETDFMSRLRQARHAALVTIAWRDLCELDELSDTLDSLTDLAAACIDSALRSAAFSLDMFPDSLIVLGMGKLGGGELNFSSDIDLILAHASLDDEDKEAELAKRCRKLAQRLVKSLNEQTADGFVYRVDTRLRPFGEAGPLVASLDAIEHYYQVHGREWERYALIKARPVAGNIRAGQALLQRLRPFVYRRYLDFSAYESMREMKALIEKQVRQRDMQDNIKLGAGGIREIEFIAQAFQLIRGGHEPALQNTRLRPVLSKLMEAGHLPERVVSELEGDYLYLRRLENRIQMWADRQTHDLPDDEQARDALVCAMGSDTWAELTKELDHVRRRVHEHFEQVFVAPQIDDSGDRPTRELRKAWDLQDEQGAALLRAQGFDDAEAAWRSLLDLQQGSLYSSLGDRGRRRLAELIPLLVQAVAAQPEPRDMLDRMLRVLNRIVGRTTYVALLVENPAVLSRLVTLCAASPWISGQIESAPVLLDSLIDPRVLYRPPRASELEEILRNDLASVAAADLESRMDTLRRFVQEQTLRVAAADVTDSMPLMTVSDHLTDLAEVTLRVALEDAWNQMVARHGQPVNPDGRVSPFAVIGYGKLGGFELGYGSDLDLVFLHRGTESADTDGEKPLSHSAFFLRLAQRVIHLLSTQTGAGRAYEIDTRLRPSGRSGLLVVSIDAFRRYQFEKAWTWEHQALVRARFVAGDPVLGEAFMQVRKEVLSMLRDRSDLQQQITTMRERMRGELDRSTKLSFDLKQGAGGLIDIEFLSQYAVLLLARDCEPLLLFTDTIRTLETLESAGYLSYERTHELTHAYRSYRRAIHDAALREIARHAPVEAMAQERGQVQQAYRDMLEKSWPD
ncbi:MAG: bifunctional [glutamate--ammonia ligase]-adenylyl-L-tyrosine phosphorylase/[glutamate--ammonia-ligase] adenylyltransferase [Salinisphaeraceae bacterium]|nr:bifunctional [glutamate--ammonia ligase]-adenylyl-L-tyrosine phosphorylase/[glutamate--ammonia-ligase] adenylyltransferase [Salinisphaeraceae bacterium]